MKNTHRHRFGELPYAMKEHWATHIHHDLRLQWNGVLLSWAMPVWLSCCVGEARTGVEMADHRVANILFEGVHETGPIMVWDRGTWEPQVECGDILASLRKGFLRFTLRGEKLHGLMVLVRKSSGKEFRRPVWELRKEADLRTGDSVHSFGLERWPNSICTGRSMEQIVRDWKKPEPDNRVSFDGVWAHL